MEHYDKRIHVVAKIRQIYIAYDGRGDSSSGISVNIGLHITKDWRWLRTEPAMSEMSSHESVSGSSVCGCALSEMDCKMLSTLES